MVKKIPLTQGQHALVDDEDFEFLTQWKWYASYYLHINNYYAQRAQHIGFFNGKQKMKTIMMHRLIMEEIAGHELKRSEEIDHINHNPLDNRRENLRIATKRQNQQNQKRKTSSKYPGICWHKVSKKWRARITLNGKRKELGLFDDEREAAKAYERACRELVGEELVCKSGGVV